MTAETVLQNVLLEIGLDNTTAQLTSSDYEIRQIKAHMNEAGKDIASRAEWSELFVNWTISGGVDDIDLPSDFHEMAETGAVRINKSGYHPIRAVVSPEQWDFLSGSSSAQPYYHLKGGRLHFSPTLASEGALVRYVSNQWVTGASEISQNSDTLKIPEKLVTKGTIWRWRRQKGMTFDDYMSEFEADLATAIKADRGAA